MPPSLGAALRLAASAVRRDAWLVPVGAGVTAARAALLWPAFALLVSSLVRAALEGFRARPFDPAAPLGAALVALATPRLLALYAGLALTGVLVGAALRVAWLAGALPTLGGAMARAPGPRFAAGAAFGFARVLSAAGLAVVADVGAGAFSTTVVLGAIAITAHAAGRGGGVLLAGAVAVALTLAVLVPVAVGALGDAAVARAAIRGEGPGEAFVGALRRMVARPGTFVLAAVAFGIAASVASASIETIGRAASGFAADAGALALAGPNLVVAAVALLVAAAIDLLRLGTFAALGCAGDAR